MLVGALSGCNEDKTPASGSTFDVPAPVAIAEKLIISEEPVVGTATEVPETEPKKLVTDGGKATPLVDPAGKAARFTEVAPSTTDGDTFVPSGMIDYDLGNLVSWSNDTWPVIDFRKPTDNELFIAPIKGWIQYPVAAAELEAAQLGPFPVIIFEHGMGDHETSYKGYDYLSEELVSHGYVVVSIHAGRNNAMGDASSQSRGQLILGTLDRLRQIDSNGQIDSDGKPGLLNALQGKLDFTRVGIMGHSRGGQGVSAAIKLNLSRLGTNADNLQTALKDSPTSFFYSYPDLAAAVTAEIKFQPAVEATPETVEPATIDEAKFALAFEKYGPFLQGATADSIKPALLKAPAVLGKLFPFFADTVVPEVTHPAVEAKPEVKAAPASLDKQKFDAALKKYNIYYAAGKEAAEPYDFKAAFMLAPTDFDGNLGLNNVPLVNLLPSCDGDVADLEGALAYDHNRFGPKTDTAPRYQILVKGANHDFYNREWGNDRVGEYCSETRHDRISLSRPNQERNGLFLINSFMRYHVGGEQKFAAYWNGHAQLPEAACEKGIKTCDERVMLTVQKSDRKRKLIQRFEKADSLHRNQLGGAIAFSGLDSGGLVRCDMSLGGGVASNCSSPQLPEFKYAGWGASGFLSVADHAELIWSQPNAVIKTDLTGLSAKGMDSLTFRIAVVHPIGQEVLVTLTDNAGKTATVTASDFSDALYNTPRKMGDGIPLVDHIDDEQWIGKLRQLLNMVAIPLKAFEGIDLTSLKELKLVFPKESGKVAITDIELQNLGRDKPAQKLAKQ
ncbi:dienelactone hydrolase [Phyllobacterium trifolii]|uniref:Dienelactone hydrolase n=1 Tax=Phyllobacterium trifolii TaxID=300193 RepID=A0A839UEB7_9HYPH|nr:hypothetical protein [Phyllobacterium trifolii]MBB3148295.1 dienelactone hydrolase [Phyllobacterium trifolii]